MSDLELWKDEKFLADDEFWLRLVRPLDPDLRRDIVGWLKAPEVETPEAPHRFGDVFMDYLRGAAQVINPFPTTPPISTLSDHEALVDDANLVCKDIYDVAIFVRMLIEEKMKRDQRDGQREQRV